MLGIKSLMPFCFPYKTNNVPFFPTQIAGLVAWYDAGSVILDGTNTYVTAWNPTYGSAVGDSTFSLQNPDATFATCPIWFESDGFMSGASTFGTSGDESRLLYTATTFSTAISMPATYYTAFYTDSTTNNAYMRFGVGTSANCHCLFVDTTPNIISADTDTATTVATSVPQEPAGVLCCHTYSSTTNNAQAWINKAITADASGTCNGDTNTGIYCGSLAAQPVTYRMCQMLIYTGLHNTTQRTNVMNYLAKYIGMAFTP